MEEPCTTRWVICRFNGSSRRHKNLVLRRNNRPTRFSSRFFFFLLLFLSFAPNIETLWKKKYIVSIISGFPWMMHARESFFKNKIEFDYVGRGSRQISRKSVFVYLTDEFNKERGTRVCVFRLFVQIIG